MMLPEEGYHTEDTVPPPLPNIPILEETITQILDEAKEEELRGAAAASELLAAQLAGGLAGVVITGPGADSYINGGQAGIDAAVAMTTSDRFGKATGYTVATVAILVGFPFFWFAVSGGAQQLHKVFVSATCGFSVHGLTLAWFLNSGATAAASINASIVLGLLVAATGFFSPRVMWYWVIVWFILILLVMSRLVPGIGGLGYVGLVPGLSSVSGFYVCIILLSFIISMVLTYVIFNGSESKELFNAIVIGVVCSCAAMSSMFELKGLSSIVEIFNIPAAFGYLKLLSIPSSMTFKEPTTLVFIGLFFCVAALGAWLNYVRYKQFGFAPQQEAASSSLLQRRTSPDSP